MSPVSPLQAAIGAAVANLTVAAVSFGVINNTVAGVCTTTATSLVSVAFIAVNELRHRTLHAPAPAPVPVAAAVSPTIPIKSVKAK